MIPPLDHRGLLPPGRHSCADWNELSDRFAFNDHRDKLLRRVMEFVRDRLTLLATGLDLVIGGSFLTDKVQPGDIDLVVVIPLDQLHARQPLLDMFGREGRKGAIWELYGAEFYIYIDGLGGNNLALFFEYVGEKSAEAKGLGPKDKRGTVRMESWTLG